jgi:hypothetical protein
MDILTAGCIAKGGEKAAVHLSLRLLQPNSQRRRLEKIGQQPQSRRTRRGIVDLEAALEQFREIASDLGGEPPKEK